MSHPTVRCYARTAAEAFKGLDYSCAIERPARSYPRSMWVAMAVGFAVALIAAVQA